MRRLHWLLAILLAGSLSLAGCQRSVEVEVGTRTVCTYGHPISDDVRTVSVPARTASAYKVKDVTETCQLHTRLEALYAEAQDALEKGDLEAAAKKLAEITKEDPGFRSATSQADEIAAGKTPAVDRSTDAPGAGGQPQAPGTGTGGAPSSPTTVAPNPGEGDTSGPVGSLLPYTPDEIDGFTALRPITDPVSITRNYRPSGSSKALTFVIIATQYRSDEIAKQIIKSQVKPAYPSSASTEKVGKRSMAFGTTNQGYAALWFTEKGIVVVLEMAAKRGDDPKALKSALLKAAEQIP